MKSQFSGSIMNRSFRFLFWLLALTTCASVALYALASLGQAPPSGPGGFIPQSLESMPAPASWLTKLSPLCVLLYALSFLPLVVLFACVKFRSNPCAITLGASLVCLSLVIEIVNALPLCAFLLVHPKAPQINPELLLYLRQMDAVRFLSLDVAGFSFAFLGLCVLALALVRKHRWLAACTFGSALLFAANVPFLWFAPWMAVLLMALSIFAFAAIPLIMTRLSLAELKRTRD